jgi:hypothetical protein
MDATERYRLIQRYLDGQVTPEEHRAIEELMAIDPDFRIEVELQQRLRTSQPDPREAELRAMMTESLQPARVDPYNYQWGKIIGGLGLTLFVLWLILTQGPALVMMAPRPSAYTPRVEETPPPPAPAPVVTEEYEPILGTPVEPAVDPTAETPAAPRPAAPFAPDEAFEGRLGYRGPTGDTIIVTSPGLAEHFPGETGVVEIPFRGSVTGTSDTVLFPLRIQIFNNQPLDGPLLEFSPDVIDRTGPWTFASTRRLRIQPGLYYFAVDRQVGPRAVYIGKFTIGQ